MKKEFEKNLNTQGRQEFIEKLSKQGAQHDLYSH